MTTQKMLNLTPKEMNALAALLGEAQLQLARGELSGSRDATLSRVVGRVLIQSADALRKRKERHHAEK